MKLRVGTRSSNLALAYTKMACDALPCDTEVVKITTPGDTDTETPIYEMGGKGVFCSTIEQELLNGNIDVAVHSLKDIPGIETEGLSITAMLQRNSPHDVLIGKVSYNSVIGTSSPRRTAQLLDFYKDLRISVKPIRGNIETRLEKLDNGDYDAIVIAEAALQALDIRRTTIKVPFIPAVGQGVIALQTRSNDLEINEIVKQANHEKTFKQATIERAFLKGMNGDCHTKIAAHATGSNPITLKAMYYE